MSITFKLENEDLTWTEHELLGDRNKKIIALTIDALRTYALPDRHARTWTVDLHDRPVLPRSSNTFFIFETRENLDLLYPGPWFLDIVRNPQPPGATLTPILTWQGLNSNRSCVKLYNIGRNHADLISAKFGPEDTCPESKFAISIEGDTGLAKAIHSGRLLFVQDRDFWDFSATVLRDGQNCIMVNRDLDDLIPKLVEVKDKDVSVYTNQMREDAKRYLNEDVIRERIFSLIFKST